MKEDNTLNRDFRSKAAVFAEVGKPLELVQFPVPETLEPDAALCRISMSTICGSDLHTVSGRRTEPTPLILGHEIVGEIVALGKGLERDGFGNKLQIGDRVSWSIMAFCGRCFYCMRDLPQKCVDLRKYGHTCCNEWPSLTGGYAEYIYLLPGTAIFKVPDNLPDEIATPANCALATVVNGAETIGLSQGETVLIQGAGLLGLNLIALAAEAGAKSIAVTDINQKRLDLALRFGADLCLNVKDLTSKDVLSQIRRQTDGYGVDVAFEVSGAKDTIALAAEALRIGGRYLIAGLTRPGIVLDIDGNQVTRKCLTIKGVHNYKPIHLARALRFLEKYCEKYPYAQLVGRTYPLSEINEALRVAESGEHIRVAVQCAGG